MQQWIFNSYQLIDAGKAKQEWPKFSLVNRTKDKGPPKLQWPEGLSEEELLRWWITSKGGYIHPALRLMKSPTCDGRGWVASGEGIGYRTVCEEPLFVIPHGLGYFNKDALTELNKLLRQTGALQDVQELVPEDLLLDIGLPLGIALAAERKKGDQSEFWPHLRLLPAEPQAPWYKTPEEQSAICDKLGLPRSRKKALLKSLAKTKRMMTNIAELILRLPNVGRLLGMTPKDVLWGVATVGVRKHSEGVQCNIKVGIDFLNHHHEAGGVMKLAPSKDSDLEDRSLLQIVLSSKSQKPKPLAAGEELFILYPTGPGIPREKYIEQHLVTYGCLMEPCLAMRHVRNGGILSITGLPALSISEQHYKPTPEEQSALTKKCWDLFDKTPDHPFKVQFWIPRINEILKKGGAEVEGEIPEEMRAQFQPLQCVFPRCPEHAANGRKQLYCAGCYVPYCSQDCQKVHWREHKTACMALAAERQRVQEPHA